MKLQQNASSARTPITDAASSRRMLKRLAIASTLVGASLLTASAHADVVLLGSDYFETVQPTFFTPLGALNPLAGLVIGPGTTDTIVQRQADCTLSLLIAGSMCTIPIELVALSLVSTVNPLVVLREAPGSVAGTSRSGGTMTMTSDGSGTGGFFISSFFDVFTELSLDGGLTFAPLADVPLSSGATPWTIIEPSPPALLVPSLVGDQNANQHTNKGACSTPPCVDFYVPFVQEQHPGVGLHSAKGATIPVPTTLALLGAGLGLMGLARRRRSA